MVDAIQHFEVHLCDKPLTVFTDHKALTNLLTRTHLNRKLWRWALYVQQFCISFEYRPGKDNLVADSRQTWPTSKDIFRTWRSLRGVPVLLGMAPLHHLIL